MASYRKKPVVIQAIPILADDYTDIREIPTWFVNAIRSGIITPSDEGGINIATKEGVMHGPVGHMLIQGVQGELYACAPDIFAETYDKE